MNKPSKDNYYKIDDGLLKYYKVYVSIFLPVFVACVGLLIAVLVYYSPWRIIITLIQIIISLKLPITVLFRCKLS